MDTSTRRKGNGLCKDCESPISKGRIRCEYHLSFVSKKASLLRRSRINRGLCGKCGQEKATRGYRCGNCYDKHYIANRKFYTKPRNRYHQLIRAAENRSKKNGMQFDVDLYKAIEGNPPMNCACCHNSFEFSYGTGKGRNDSPSLDRVNNKKGYTLENTRVICSKCNNNKSDMSIDDIEMILYYIISNT